MITVSIATAADESRWQHYCQSRALDHHAHAWGWREVLQKTFGHEPYYLIAQDNDRALGILPLFFVQSRLFGRSLISVPYLNAGGILSDNEDTAKALIEYSEKLAQDLKVKYCEYRQRTFLDIPSAQLITRQHKVAMCLPLADSTEILFSAFSAKLRSQINRPQKEGATTKISCGADGQAINDFYEVFAQHMQSLGTPAYPQDLFRRTAETFGDKAFIVVTYNQKKPVAVGFLIGVGQNIEILWASALKSENRYSPNMLMYWESIKIACERGYKLFDFGRSSPDSGTYRFKEQWGAKPLPLHWQYTSSSAIPNISPQNSSFSALITLWKILPAPLARFLGRHITKHIPS